MMDTNVFLIIMRLFLHNKTHTHYDRITKGWVIEKWNFFKKDCLLSIKGQSSKDFKLVVLIDPTFPHYNLVKEEVEKEAKTGSFDLQYVNFEWGDGVPFSQANFHVNVANFTNTYINSHYPNCKWLITARLDGDDIIARKYVEKIWSINKVGKEGWIILKNGYYFSRDGFVVDDNIYNAHLVYCEPCGSQIKTVYHRMHNSLAYQGPADNRFTIIDDTSQRWWADRVAENTNIKKKKEWAFRSKRFQLLEKLKTPLEMVQEEFDVA
jgi:hypothetical protein